MATNFLAAVHKNLDKIGTASFTKDERVILST
jgi:hypothetical protein